MDELTKKLEADGESNHYFDSLYDFSRKEKDKKLMLVRMNLKMKKYLNVLQINPQKKIIFLTMLLQ